MTFFRISVLCQRSRAGILAALLTGICLAACSPRFNWRSDPGASGFAATFPGTIDSLSRPLNLDGLSVTMTVHGARAGNLSFALGWADLPDESPATAARAGSAVTEGLSKSMGGQARVHPATVRAAERAALPWPAQAVSVTATQDGSPWRLEARVVARPGRVYEVLVAGPAAALATPDGSTAVDTFFESVEIQ